MPSFASAGNLRDAGTPWDHPKALALGPFATLGLVGTRWDSLGLVGTRAMFTLATFSYTPVHIWDSRELRPL